MDSNFIEEISVEVVKKILRKMSRQYNTKDVKYEVNSNDKGAFTDGYISVEGRRVDIQVKGRVKSDKKYQVDAKYLKYAANQLLLFIVVSGISIDDETYSTVLYQFMSIEFLENLRDKKHESFEQKTVTVTFNRKLENYLQFFKDFNTEVRNSHTFKTFNPEKNMKYIGKIKANWKVNPDQFNSSFTTSDFSLYDRFTGIEYYADNGMQTISINTKEEHEVEFENEVFKLVVETDLVDNKRLSTANVQVDLIKNSNKVHYKVSYPEYLNDVTQEDVYLLKQITSNINEDRASIVESYVELYKTKEKIFSKIPDKYNLKLEHKNINYIYNVLFTELPSNIEASNLMIIGCENEALVLVFNNYTRTYDYLDNDAKVFVERYGLDLHPVTIKVLSENKWSNEFEIIKNSNSNLKQVLFADFKSLLLVIMPMDNQIHYYSNIISILLILFDKEWFEDDVLKDIISTICYPSQEFETYPIALIINFLLFKLKVNEKLNTDEIYTIVSIIKKMQIQETTIVDLVELLLNEKIEIADKYDTFPLFIEVKKLLLIRDEELNH